MSGMASKTFPGKEDPTGDDIHRRGNINGRKCPPELSFRQDVGARG
jgi:hypothetical protein